MDIAIYVGVALLLAVLLFLGLNRKPAEAAKELVKKDEDKPAAATKPAAAAKPAVESGTRPEKTAKGEPPPAKPEPPSSKKPALAKAEPAQTETLKKEAEPPPERAEPPAPPSSGTLSEPTPKDRPQEVDALRVGLARSRESGGFFGRLRALFVRKGEISPQLVTEIEEVLLSSDVGVATTSALLATVRDQLSKGELKDHAAVWAAVRRRVTEVLSTNTQSGLNLSKRPTVVLLVGVNGAGKTTTIGKLATQLRSQGKKCVLAAGDTFRAAAVQQLVVWGERVGCEVVRGKDGSDPGSVIFDAIKRAEELGADVVLADTAGRLHTKSNLMSEMQKIARTIGKAMDGAPHETLLVIDATTGQNALAQAEEFKQKLSLTGIVLTKLDGTAKGGVVLGIANSLQLPVRFVGLGERPDDLHSFMVEDFVEALLGGETTDAS